MAKLNKKLAAALAVIVAAGSNGDFVALADGQALANLNFAELNPNGPNDQGQIQARATQAGIEAHGEAPAAAPVKTSFALVADIPLPTSSGRGGRGGETYPFDQLAVGQSFFVPNTEAKPKAAKSMASTVSSATARYAVEVPGETRVDRKGNTVPKTEETRKFVVRAVEDGAPWGHAGVAGAGIWRTA
jgi:hypothetical protein